MFAICHEDIDDNNNWIDHLIPDYLDFIDKSNTFYSLLILLSYVNIEIERRGV